MKLGPTKEKVEKLDFAYFRLNIYIANWSSPVFFGGTKDRLLPIIKTKISAFHLV